MLIKISYNHIQKKHYKTPGSLQMSVIQLIASQLACST